jgi:hypothetical protein
MVSCYFDIGKQQHLDRALNGSPCSMAARTEAGGSNPPVSLRSIAIRQM